eukprot:TRINITY_DN12749_c0_g1_i2.p1 TRINITY_DN12749_c0_g1~~TRINITY_DN12749_c0_g1_i2.p1  ORF type:complete len:162 (+),score=23.73 TRINITY_DN12749_c0_g1_i2:109-594(+)
MNFFFDFLFFFNDTATTEIYTLHIVGSVRCVQESGILISLSLFEPSELTINRVFFCFILIVESCHFSQSLMHFITYPYVPTLSVVQGPTYLVAFFCRGNLQTFFFFLFLFPCTLRLSLIHISEPTRLGMISYAVFCLKKKNKKNVNTQFNKNVNNQVVTCI